MQCVFGFAESLCACTCTYDPISLGEKDSNQPIYTKHAMVSHLDQRSSSIAQSNAHHYRHVEHGKRMGMICHCLALLRKAFHNSDRAHDPDAAHCTFPLCRVSPPCSMAQDTWLHFISLFEAILTLEEENKNGNHKGQVRPYTKIPTVLQAWQICSSLYISCFQLQKKTPLFGQNPECLV